MRRFSWLTFLFVVLFVCADCAYGQDYTPDMTGRFCVGAGLGRSEPEHVNDEVYGLRVIGEYYLKNWLSIAAEYQNYEWEGVFEPLCCSGQLDASILSGAVVFNFPQWSSYPLYYNAYLGIGADWYFFDTELVGGAPGEVDDCAGFHVNAGVNWFLTERLAVNVDFRYNMVEPDFTYGDLSLNSFVIGVGAKIYF